jgi:signal transduction histidine kinase
MVLVTGLAMRNWFASLQFRLILAFTLVLVLALGSVSLCVGLASHRAVDRFEQRREEVRAARVQQLVSRFYSRDRGWANLQPALEQAGPLAGQRIIVTDAKGIVVGDSQRQLGRPNIYHVPEGHSFPIEIGGQRVGSLTVVPSEDRTIIREPPVGRFASAVNRSLFWAGLTAVGGGILLIVFLSRRILAPVQALTAAAQQLGRGDLTQRVSTTGPGEIGQLARTFNNMAKNLETAEEQRRSLVADVAHELRTPLSNIQGYLEAVKDGLLQPDDQTLDTIYQQVIQVVQLVEDLRLLALTESGMLRLNVEPGHVEDLLRQGVDAFRPRAEAKGVNLVLRLPPESPEVQMDQTRISQVVANLLDNAIFHTPRGGLVTVSAEAKDSSIRVIVADTGSGIPPEAIPWLFERFYRVDPSRTRATGGTGLGLTIAKQLVEAHGGSIGVESAAGSGNRFFFDLPLNHKNIPR